MSEIAPNTAANASPPPAVDDELRAAIDDLMAGPVRSRPLITVVGDDAVSGFNPAPPPGARPSPTA